MSQNQSGYLLGIGSNIDPHNNITQIITLLFEHFPSLSLSRVLEIPPIGMNSEHDFLNLVVFIQTDQAEVELKAICNRIEIQLGRNRNDPQRKTKDRPADLDILSKIELPDDAERPSYMITDEYFLYPLLEELIAHLMQQTYQLEQAGIELNVNTLSFGQAATTINWNTGTADKGVI